MLLVKILCLLISSFTLQAASPAFGEMSLHVCLPACESVADRALRCVSYRSFEMLKISTSKFGTMSYQLLAASSMNNLDEMGRPGGQFGGRVKLNRRTYHL